MGAFLHFGIVSMNPRIPLEKHHTEPFDRLWLEKLQSLQR
uniref:Uncharacterized protein n=1 Tax=Arundo donax TaxID=35708 RepID=A0A0A9S803_ARUDO